MSTIIVIDVDIPNSGAGDPLRVGGVAINSNFANLNIDKLEKGAFAGTATDLSNSIISVSNLSTPNGGYAGTALDLLSLINAISRTTTRVIATATIADTDYQWNGNTDAGGFTLTLPAGIQDANYKIVNTGTSSNILSVAPNGSENLIGANSAFDLQDGESLIISYDTTDGWY